jgi:hypothetical protein
LFKQLHTILERIESVHAKTYEILSLHGMLRTRAIKQKVNTAARE